MRKAVRVEQRVAVTLWRLATNVEYRTIAHLFGVTKSTAWQIVNEVCGAVVRKFFRRYVCVPSGGGLSEIIQGFAQVEVFLSVLER